MRRLDSITVNGHEFEQTVGDSGGGQKSLVCCRPWGRRVRHDLVTEQQLWAVSTDPLTMTIMTFALCLEP